MNKIAKLAEQKFDEFCRQEGSVHSGWSYLSKKRQLAWMEEVLATVTMVIKSMQATVKPAVPGTRFDTIWLQGYNAGQVAERTVFIEYLQQVLEQSKQEVEDFKGNIQDD